MALTNLPAFVQSTTVQSIVNEVSQDIRKQLASTGTDAAIIQNYVQRVQNELLQYGSPKWLQSVPYYFVTRPGITDYWLNVADAIALAAPGAAIVDLNLSDVSFVNRVTDITAGIELARLDRVPVGAFLPDGSIANGNPIGYIHDVLTHPDSPSTINVLRIFPVPSSDDNGRTMVGPAPSCYTAESGALTDRVYYVKLSLIDSFGGEGLVGPEVAISVPENYVLTVRSPFFGTGRYYPAIPQTSVGNVNYDGYNIYVGETSGDLTLQATVDMGIDWQEPDSGLISGTEAPASSTLTEIGGHVIEFTYLKQKQTFNDLSDVLQIPDAYKDVVIAGTNAYTFLYLKMPDEAGIWNQVYEAGKARIIKDKNFVTGVYGTFIKPGR